MRLVTVVAVTATFNDIIQSFPLYRALRPICMQFDSIDDRNVQNVCEFSENRHSETDTLQGGNAFVCLLLVFIEIRKTRSACIAVML